MSNIDSPDFRSFIKKYTNVDLKSAVTLDRNYTINLADECQDHIRNIFAEDRLIIGIDETIDAMSRTIAGSTIKSADHPEKGVYLLNYDEILEGNAVYLADFIIESLESVFGPMNNAGIFDHSNERRIQFE